VIEFDCIKTVTA